jgi:hypothetical protein
MRVASSSRKLPRVWRFPQNFGVLRLKDEGSFEIAVASSSAVVVIVCNVDDRELLEVRVVNVTDDSVGGEGVSEGSETFVDSGRYS